MLVIGLLIMLSTSTYARKGSIETPWETLFNGKDFKGWKVLNDENNVRIEDSCFVCHPVANTKLSTFLCTEKTFGDFIFEVDAKIDGGLHTNFLLRSKEVKMDSSKANVSGYQVKIDPTVRRWTGGIFDGGKSGIEWYYPLTGREEAQSAFKINEWNHYRMEAIGDSIKVWVNGIPTSNLVHDKYSNGGIGIKIHSIGNFPEMEKMLMRFKNMKIITKNPAKFKKSLDYPVINLKEK